jgi:threonine aldolase
VGGGMRQAGILAAAGLYALDHHVQRLAQDHAHAAQLAQGVQALGYAVEAVQTNMVYVQLDARAGAFKDFAAARGIAVHAAPRLRMVTHLDVDAAQIEQVVGVFADFART